VLFNRFYQPDFDIDQLEVTPSLNSAGRRIAIAFALDGHSVWTCAGRPGDHRRVHSSRDLLKCILAGAKWCFMTSALLRNGVQHAAHVLSEATDGSMTTSTARFNRCAGA